MKKKQIAVNLFFAVICAIFLNKPTFSEPANLDLLRKEVQVYHDSGAYHKELTDVTTRADHFILQRAKVNTKSDHPKKLAIVLDIDETSLSNYNKMLARHFVADHKQIHQDILKADAPVIKPMLLLYEDALKHGITVFFITGRPESERTATMMNLKSAGFHHWAHLYLRPNHYHKKSITPFKSKTRASISKQGYEIIASIGDQYSDLKGGYAEKTFKLPNPYYYLP